MNTGGENENEGIGHRAVSVVGEHMCNLGKFTYFFRLGSHILIYSVYSVTLSSGLPRDQVVSA